MNAAEKTGLISVKRSIWPEYMGGPVTRRTTRTSGPRPGVIGPAELEGVFQAMAAQYPHAVVGA